MLLAAATGCDLSSVFGGSAAFVNNSDAEVAVTMPVNGYCETIAARSTGSPVSISPDEIENGNITLELEGIYYYSSEREYAVRSQEITLDPDCAWLKIINSTGSSLSAISLSGAGADSYPRAEQDFQAQEAQSAAENAAIYIPMPESEGDGKRISLSFSADGTGHTAVITGLTLQHGTTKELQLVRKDGDYSLQP